LRSVCRVGAWGLSRGVKPKSRKTVFINNFADISHGLVYPFGSRRTNQKNRALTADIIGDWNLCFLPFVQSHFVPRRRRVLVARLCVACPCCVKPRQTTLIYNVVCYFLVIEKIMSSYPNHELTSVGLTGTEQGRSVKAKRSLTIRIFFYTFASARCSGRLTAHIRFKCRKRLLFFWHTPYDTAFARNPSFLAVCYRCLSVS
jgi:hypothetical protein